MSSVRQHLVNVLEGLDSTVHATSPRSMSMVHCHAEVEDAVDAILEALGLDGQRDWEDLP